MEVEESWLRATLGALPPTIKPNEIQAAMAGIPCDHDGTPLDPLPVRGAASPTHDPDAVEYGHLLLEVAQALHHWPSPAPLAKPVDPPLCPQIQGANAVLTAVGATLEHWGWALRGEAAITEDLLVAQR